MAKIIAIANQKGGVGKTTTTINLGGCLGVLEYKTLIVDADPQANATSGVGLDPKNSNNIYDCLINGSDPTDLIIKTDNPNLDILPSHIDLVGAELEMINLPNREHMLKFALEKVRNQCDFIIIDCSPSLGLITVNSLTAADTGFAFISSCGIRPSCSAVVRRSLTARSTRTKPTRKTYSAISPIQRMRRLPK